MPSRISELHVERHRGLIDVYRLVGLARWESDVTRIQQAIAEARVLLGQSGSRAQEHSQLSGYVTEAARILTDAARKQRYDVSLRQAIEAEGESATLTSSPAVTAATLKPAPLPLTPIAVAAPAGSHSTGASQPVAAPRLSPAVMMRPIVPRTPLWRIIAGSAWDTAVSVGSWLLRCWEWLHGGAPVRLLLALVFAGGVAVFLLSRLDWSATFPQTTVAPRAAGAYSMTATLSLKPAIESIPGQRVGMPRMIPGLEESEGYAPTLNGSLTHIVFASKDRRRKTGDLDLFLATRSRPFEAFQTPGRLTECSSDDTETDPTLSPDGLELVFVRIGPAGDASLMRSVRNALAEPFFEPQVINIPELPTGRDIIYDSPQLLQSGGDLLVRVTRTTSSGPNATIFLCPRASADTAFEAADPLPVFVEQARHFLSPDGLRAFVSRYHTIQLCCRPTTTVPFSNPGKLDVLNATRIGSAEGPIWISPAEDFLFYSVTIPNSAHQQRRYLRQVRIR